MSELYRVRIKKGEFEVEVESHDAGYVDAKLKEYLSVAPGAPRKDENTAEGGVAGGQTKPLSLKEFTASIEAKSGKEAALAIVYFAEKHEGKPQIETSEVKSRLKKTLKLSLKNPADAITKARTDKWLMDGDDPGTVRSTSTGDKWIEERLKERERGD